MRKESCEGSRTVGRGRPRSMSACRTALRMLGRRLVGTLEDEGMIGIAVGDTESDPPVEHIAQKLAADFCPPTLQNARRLSLAARLMPADEITQVGRSTHERFRHVECRALIHE